MDDCIQGAMLRCTCMQVPSITAVGPIFTEKLTKTEKKIHKINGPRCICQGQIWMAV